MLIFAVAKCKFIRFCGKMFIGNVEGLLEVGPRTAPEVMRRLQALGKHNTFGSTSRIFAIYQECDIELVTSLPRFPSVKC